jgi:hypothetical protein
VSTEGARESTQTGASGGPIDEAGRVLLQSILMQYDMVTGWWSKLSEECAEAGEPEPLSDCNKYSDALEGLAHRFAEAIRDTIGED